MNNKASIDYLKLMGAQVMSVEINGKKQNCVVIPCAWNGINVIADKTTGQPKSAFQNLYENETSAKYREICVENHKDEEGYLPPSHQIAVAYPEELRNAYKKRIEERLRADKEFMATNPSEDQIKQQVGYKLTDQSRIGYVTPIKRQEPQPYTEAAPVASVAAYVPTEEVQPGDDLPF